MSLEHQTSLARPLHLVILTILAMGLFAAPLDAPIPTDTGTPVPLMKSQYDSDGDGAMTADELKQAITDLEEEYEFPDGYVLDLDAMFKLIDALGTNSLHQNGGEYAWLGAAHMCAWGDNWLKANEVSDTAQVDESMDQLMTVTLTNPMYGQDIVDRYRQIFNAAQAGNTDPLELLLNQQCRWEIFTIEGSGGTPIATPADE